MWNVLRRRLNRLTGLNKLNEDGAIFGDARHVIIVALAALVIICGCSKGGSGGSESAQEQRFGVEGLATKSVQGGRGTATNVQTYAMRGVVTKLIPGNKTVEIRHEAVTNFMPAMTMPFDVKDPAEISSLKVDDQVTFRLSVTDKDSWIDQIKKVEGKSLTELPATNGFRFTKDVEPLQVGDSLPDYHFTNQLGQAVSTAKFKGQALALTFIFTRCPLPNFCPRMSSNFQEVQDDLLKSPLGDTPGTNSIANGSQGTSSPTLNFTNWHLLTISFDPEFDKPAVLKSYAERFHADSAHWSFLTGDPTEIRAIADQFGEAFWKDETGSINHNLRTVVVDARGRIHQIFTGNNWTAGELIESLAAAAK